MFNFTFLKPYYSEVEILELFNISKSTLQRYREECLKMGGNLFEDMGYFHINGTKSAMYEPVKFSNWLLTHKINLPKKEFDWTDPDDVPYESKEDEDKENNNG